MALKISHHVLLDKRRDVKFHVGDPNDLCMLITRLNGDERPDFLQKP